MKYTLNYSNSTFHTHRNPQQIPDWLGRHDADAITHLTTFRRDLPSGTIYEYSRIHLLNKDTGSAVHDRYIHPLPIDKEWKEINLPRRQYSTWRISTRLIEPELALSHTSWCHACGAAAYWLWAVEDFGLPSARQSVIINSESGLSQFRQNTRIREMTALRLAHFKALEHVYYCMLNWLPHMSTLKTIARIPSVRPYMTAVIGNLLGLGIIILEYISDERTNVFYNESTPIRTALEVLSEI